MTAATPSYAGHPGSVAFLTTTGQSEQSGTRVRYLPFGAFRTTPTATISDRGFTGHKHNTLAANNGGLIDMNALYYAIDLARFASAEKLVPAPMYLQSLRFSRHALG